ncbi:aspartyl protease family protein [Hymenobacter sp. GOD-10R]|uniref:aspartyl protease family protein n=1 Tax=Hymenobacter sp. GOD-10R TaxID=3093922 RepID=UPI002D77C889|nr:aspartyl protease family protein [Hymenobacter sp. GOD-10R]WRQ26214.1 aspartyl protease family protein [Hymenobacter sp. GOD-10R]
MKTNGHGPRRFAVAQHRLLTFFHVLLGRGNAFRYRATRLLWLCLLLSGTGYAADPDRPGEPGGTANYSQRMPFRFKRAKLQRVTISYELQSDLIVISAKLNGLGPFNFLLDTGAASSLITDPQVSTLLGLSPDSKAYSLAGVGQQAPITAYRTKPVRVDIAGIEAPAFSFIAVTENVLDLAGLMGTPVHGILGYDLFRSFVVTIQPRVGRITFSDPTLQAPLKGEGWTSVPILIEDSKPYLKTTIKMADSAELPVKLVLDTGAGHALSLETSSDPRLHLPANRLRTDLGRSLSGTITGYLGRVPALQLGSYQIHSLLTSFPDSSNLSHRIQIPRNGTLGFDALRRFNIVIDYPHNQLLLRPNSAHDHAFEYDMSGAQLLATGPEYRQFLITNIAPNSAAAAAGLKPNDELLSIGVKPADGYSLAQINHLFQSGDGRAITLIVRRSDGEIFRTSLRLKRRI